MIALCRRFTSLDRPERRLVLEAASSMALVWIGLRLLRYPTLRHVLDRYAGSPAGSRSERTRASATCAVGWAVAAVAARCPWATCLVQALAGNALLRRRGVVCELRIGVRVRDEGAVAIEAHAWLECDGAVAIGAIENLSHFKPLTALRAR